MAIVFRTRAEEIALGMTLLGLFFSSVLYGLALSQLYTYYKRFPRDPLSVKILVIATAILDTVSVVLECHACWYYLVTTGPMTLAVWSLNAELAVSMFISGIAEAFMTYRVWMLSGRQNILTCVLNGDNDMDTPVLPRFTRGLSKAISEKRKFMIQNTGRSRPTQIDVFVVTETLTTSDDIHHSSSKATSRSSILSSQLKDEISSNPNFRPALCNESGSFSNFSTSSSGSVQEGIKEIPRVVIRG
ncbi:hypothetical protein C8R42DRAFT_715981 [Lentinula raphanica]|nr:hypothetical protein C8R42DRAFT_715981 [Lentinula raphanica]